MSTKITADNGVELEVCHLGIDATNPNSIEPSSIWARLTAEQRTKLAAALAPERSPVLDGRPVHGITATCYVGDAPINPADCDRTAVYTGECRNFADTEWIRFDSGRRRSPDARDGNTWLIDVAYGSFWMADDKVRNLVPLVPAPTGGQWTRDDLPSPTDVRWERTAETWKWRPNPTTDHVLDAVVAHLNTHHPKPDGIAVSMLEAAWDEAQGRAAMHERKCDELRSLIEGQKEHVSKSIEVRNRMRCERDAAVARAEQSEQLIPAYAMLDVWGALGRDSIHFDDWYDERGYADAWAELAAAVREAAEARTAPAVSRADIEKAIQSCCIVRPYEDDVMYVAVAEVHESLCRAIEAEQAVDPVEKLTDDLADILYGNELVTDQMRGVLERVVRAGMLLPEQEADQ